MASLYSSLLGQARATRIARQVGYREDLEGDAAFDRFPLLGHINDAEPAGTNFLQQLVAANLSSRPFQDGGIVGHRGNTIHSGTLHESTGLRTGLEQRFDTRPERRVASARSVEVQLEFLRGHILRSVLENL